jgi:anti-sigma-K factor RskA
MSATILPDDEDRTVLAGEYVLGTLPSDEAERVADEAIRDPALAGAIAEWEQRLAPLAATVAPQSPPASLWPRIERTAYGPRAAGRAGRRDGTQGVQGARSLTAWKGATAVSFLIAASVAGIALFDRVPMATPVAVLAPLGAPQAAFVIEARADGVVSVLPLHPAIVPTGRDLELWSLAEGEKVPHPLGLLPAGGTKLAAGVLPPGHAQILISLEPAGGSPTGLPTGPVLYGGVLTRAD